MFAKKNPPQKISGLFALLGRAADLAADIGFGKVGGLRLKGDSQITKKTLVV